MKRVSHYRVKQRWTIKVYREISVFYENNVKIIEYGFYTINPEYLEYLNKVEPEVYYNDSYRNTVKPHVGIIIGINEYNYLFL